MLNIVLPMAGRGSRFANAGYTTPKPLLDLAGQPMIRRVVENIQPSTPHRLIFLCLQEHLDDIVGLEDTLRALHTDVEIVPVCTVTEGAACTVLLARALIDTSDPLMIANSDQWVDVSIDDYLAAMNGRDGLIMTFFANDPKWSYCRMNDDGRVTEVVEKQVVSNEATVGIYNFRKGSDFVSAADEMIAANERVKGEFYVAPVYNYLIRRGARLGVHNIGAEGDGMYGLGVPEDYEAFKLTEHYGKL